jgi:hypothetical protein
MTRTNVVGMINDNCVYYGRPQNGVKMPNSEYGVKRLFGKRHSKGGNYCPLDDDSNALGSCPIEQIGKCHRLIIRKKDVHPGQPQSHARDESVAFAFPRC